MQIKEYIPGDEKHILQLFGRAFGKPLSPEFWQWRYAHNPFTPIQMISLMWDGNILAGHYAVFPVELNIHGSKMLSALSMTTMTHPDYAGRGIFTQLAEHLYTRIKEEFGVSLVWGFPNRNSHGAFIKNLTWSDLGTIPTLRLKDNSLLKMRKNEYTLINDFSENNLTFPGKKDKITVNKTTRYLNWRYINNPVNKYYIIKDAADNNNNFMVIKVFSSFEKPGTDEIDILEHSYGNSFEAAAALTGCVVKFAEDKKLSLNAVNTWMSLHNPQHLHLERLGFVMDVPVTFAGGRELLTGSGILSNFKDWNLSMGDSDVY